MAASILMTYLRLNLLELGGDDSRLQKLSNAASELADDFALAPLDALPVFLASLETDQADNEVFGIVATAIENNWATYRGAFQGGAPTTLYKAITFQALAEAIEIQPVLGTAISLLMRNLGPHLQIGKSKPAFDLLVDAADSAFGAAFAKSKTRKTEQKLNIPKATKPQKFNRQELQKRIEAAVGPHNRQSVAGETPNEHFPNAGAAWSYEFSDRLTLLLADYVDSAVKWASDMDAKNLQNFGNRVEEFAKVDPTIEGATSLLWWRQALYSESAKQPYRELPGTDAVVHAVVDLSALIPAAYERALESFLMEAILHLLPSTEEIAGSALLQVSPEASSTLANAVEEKAPRGLLYSTIAQGESTSTIVQISLPPHKWAVWLLRELKALQALENPEPVPDKEGQENE